MHPNPDEYCYSGKPPKFAPKFAPKYVPGINASRVMADIKFEEKLKRLWKKKEERKQYRDNTNPPGLLAGGTNFTASV